MEAYTSPSHYLCVAANGSTRHGTLSSQASDTLSSRASVSSSFYSSSGFSDDEDWEEDVDGEAGETSGGSLGSNGEDCSSSTDSYRRRLSEESRKRLVRKLDSIRCNPNHYVRRIVPVSNINGGAPLDPREVGISRGLGSLAECKSSN